MGLPLSKYWLNHPTHQCGFVLTQRSWRKVRYMKQRLVLLGLLVLNLAVSVHSSSKDDAPIPKNIILMVGDGMGPAHISAFRIFNDDPSTPDLDPLLLDSYLVGTLSTEPYLQSEDHDYEVTDSAASATAYSTGKKTYNGAIAYNVNQKPIPTILEVAKHKGKKVGLVATSQIVHATPAAFIAHAASRRDYNSIADQFLDNRWQGRPLLDVFLGGGWRYFDRKDRNLIEELRAEGYQVVRTASQLNTAGNRLAGLFADVALPAKLDRSDEHPSLAQMTQAAIQRLNHSEGFFLMVEGSQIDWASHENDVVDMLHEMDDFYQAIGVAIDYATTRNDTLVLITADHETGGFSIGHEYKGKSQYRFNPKPIKVLKRSIAQYAQRILDSRDLNVFLADLGEETNENELEIWQQLVKQPSLNLDDIKQLLKSIMNRVTYSGWTTHGHTGVDVNLYAVGQGAEWFRGHHRNTYIGQTLLNWVQTPLFVKDEANVVKTY
jgi:alkaline phosphatase